MAGSDPNTIGAIPFYKSPQMLGLIVTFVSAFIALFPKLGKALGLNTPDDVNAAVSAVFGFIAVLAPVVGAVLRAKSTVQPITVTQTGADNHPATIAATTKTSTVTVTPKEGT